MHLIGSFCPFEYSCDISCKPSRQRGGMTNFRALCCCQHKALTQQARPIDGRAACGGITKAAMDVDESRSGQTLSPWHAEDLRRGTHRRDSGSGRGRSSGGRLGAAERGHVTEDLAAGDGRAAGAGVPLRQLGREGRQDVAEHRAVAGCTHACTLSASLCWLPQARPPAATSTCSWAGTPPCKLGMKGCQIYRAVAGCRQDCKLPLSCLHCAFKKRPLQHAVPKATHVHRAKCCVWSWG